MTEHQLLLRLQQLDKQSAVLEEQRQRNGLSAYEARESRLREELLAKSGRCEQLEQELVAGQAELMGLENEIDSLNIELARASGYDIALVQNRLTPALERKSALEEVLLQIMLELEDLPGQLPPLREALVEVQAELEEARPEEQERLDDLGMRLQVFASERLMVVEQLPQPLVVGYEKTGRIDEIRQGRCRCRLEIPDHYQRQIRLGHGWMCASCGSVLVQTLTP